MWKTRPGQRCSLLNEFANFEGSMILIFDTETTGLPRDWNAPLSDGDNWPRLVQLAWQLHDKDGKLISRGNQIVQPEGFTIPYNSTKIHGITTERAQDEGVPLSDVVKEFMADAAKAKYVMGHNIGFDVNVVGAELLRLGQPCEPLTDMAVIDSKDEGTDFCAIPGGRGGKFKWPTLTELHLKLFGKGFGDAHDAAYDVAATARCFFEMVRLQVIKRPEFTNHKTVKYEAPKLEAANFEAPKKTKNTKQAGGGGKVATSGAVALEDVPFTHLHVHSQFSVLQAVSPVGELVSAAKEMGMQALAVTDHGNMMAAFQFVRACNKAGIKPIVGAELNVCRNMHDKSVKDDGYPTVFLAKNKNGYHNLAKLASKAYTEGFYYVPRIDRELVAQYKEDLVVLTGGLFGEVPSLILNVGEAQAEEAFVFWKDLMGEDFYAELNRHGLEEETVVNGVLQGLASTHGVKMVASNNSYYTRKDQSDAHDILLCVKDARNVSQPKKYVGKRGREFRFGFPNDSFYLKSPQEMKELFADVPEAITNVASLVDQCEGYVLERDVLLPAFDIPAEFVHEEDAKDGGKRGENAYLRHLTYLGAKKRYGEITDEIRERIDFELETIERTGYPGYFLIVQDFTTAARDMGVSVGPGRGSAAGSAVAYCVGITNVDPIKYDLLFERFLNPDRVSLPDIDIDFDDEGRGKVIDYVINKYGANQVAQIITYGTMAAKSSIRDTARVMELPLGDADRLAKLVPDISLKKMFSLDDKALKEKVRSEGFAMVEQLKAISQQPTLEGQTLQTARVLEGSVRNTGIHACGVIITPDDITNFVPVATAKDSDMACTQFDNAVAEDAGLLKMDFLGLKTLTVIKDAVKNVKLRHGKDLDPDSFPLDDPKTYELFQRGDTVGIFQYESAGMQKHLKALQPTVFEDLIAMNALYRPGPMEYIPDFVARKHGRQAITYDLDACQEYLEETYGITVYQEQVMLLSQKLAGFTKGEADSLRKAMGKKKKDIIDKMKPDFMTRGVDKGHDAGKLEKIWTDWEAFASYAFNKSHSTCYAWIAYQTAYLKANYPAEFMAAQLSNNMNDIKEVTNLMEEARRQGVRVLGPDVNESAFKFTVNKEGAIRFGLGAMRGVGEGAVLAIIEGRSEAPYASLFDFARRVNLKDCNKRVFEALALGGGFDSFGLHRAQFFALDAKERPLLELAVRYGAATQESESSAQVSLFGGDEGAMDIPEPPVPECAPWADMDLLNKERDIVGVYISGHPLDRFRLELDHLCAQNGLTRLENLEQERGKTLTFGGLITSCEHRISKSGRPWGFFALEDYTGTHEFRCFGEDYVKFKEFMVEGWMVLITTRVQEQGFGRDGMEAKLQSIELLSEAREKRIGRLRVQVQLSALNDGWVDTFAASVAKHPGSVGVTLEIYDDEAKLEMPSRTSKVQLDDAFVATLEELCIPGKAQYRLDMKR
jgi:DNA polymerase-3 subunit alpha